MPIQCETTLGTSSSPLSITQCPSSSRMEVPRLTPSMRSARDTLNLDRLDVVHAGTQRYQLGPQIPGFAGIRSGEQRRHGRTDSRASSPPVARPRPPFRDDPCAIGSEIDTHGPGPFDRDATGISYSHRAQNSSNSQTYNADGPEIPIMDATSFQPGMELAAPARVVARAPAAEPAINASRILLPSSNPAMR